MNKIVRFLWLVGLIQPTFAQNARIEGTVVEPTARQPLEFSTVSLYRSPDSALVTGTVTNQEGKFILKNVSEGTYYLAIQFLGYQKKLVSVASLSHDQVLVLGTIPLLASESLLKELVVSGQKATVLHQIDRQVYSAAQFQSAQGGTATDVLRNLPSVSVNGEGEITLRGSSSFLVLLDGQAVQSDPTLILGQLPANVVESVEVITTPSSKYDPDGKAGIIQITTKKGTTDGLYLITNAQAGLPSVRDYGNAERPHRYGGDVTINYKKKRWNLSLAGSYKRDDIAGYREGEAQTTNGQVITSFPSLGERSYQTYSSTLKGSASYTFNQANSLEVGFYIGNKSQLRRADILYQQQRFNRETGEVLQSFTYFNQNLRERKGDGKIVNLNYQHTFPNRATLALSGLYEKTILGGPTRNQDVNPDNPAQQYTHALMSEDNPLDGVRIKADYAQPLGAKSKWESGYQYRYVQHIGAFAYTQRDPASDTWQVLPDLSNQVKLTRGIHAVYSQVSGSMGKVTYAAGLRLEHTNRILHEGSTSKLHTFERLNLFPSANLLYTLGQGYQLKAGYSRRIVHATTQMMNPFMARRHSETLETGDPDLLPEYIDVAEGGVVKTIGNGSVFANVYYQGTQHVINRVNAVYNDTILLRTYTNAGRATSYGLELGMDWKPTAWWTLYAGGNVYQYAIRGSVYQNQVNQHSLNYSFHVNTTFRFSSSLSLQANVNYTSRTVTAQGEDSYFLLPGATLKKTFLGGRGSLNLQWSNISLGWLKSNQQRITTGGDNFYTSTNYIQEVDIFRINIGYQLSKLTRKLKFTESEFGEKEF